MANLGGRFKNAWNAFTGRDPTYNFSYIGQSSGYNPGSPRINAIRMKSAVSSIYNKIAVDCSTYNIVHARLDEEGNFISIIKDSLNDILTINANIDQSGKDLIRDTAISMLDEGVIALVPYESYGDPLITDSYRVLKTRTAKILQWYPEHILVEIYNEYKGVKQQLLVEKRICPIIENPFFAIMNEPNSTAQRLMKILNQLDRTNEQNSSGKIDMIIQLPYSTRSKLLTKRADDRRKDIEQQLTGSQHGIAYIDATEKVIQLNRSVENNLWEQAKDLHSQLFSELGFSPGILDNTADEKTMLNYYNRIIDPIILQITEGIERKWISSTARSQGQAIRSFRDPFKFVTITQLADASDSLKRNEVLSSNEIRSAMGYKPSNDPKADQLINSNLNHPEEKEIKNENPSVNDDLV